MANSLHGKFIKFSRETLGEETMAGFVLDYNEELTLIHYVDMSTFKSDGYRVFQNNLVSSWTTYDDPACFVNRALRLRRTRPRRLRGIDISCWHATLNTVGRAFPLIVFHREEVRPDVCQVGRFIRATPKTVVVHEISPELEWEGKSRFRLSEITRIDFGSGYEDALWQLAAEDGPPPDVGA